MLAWLMLAPLAAAEYGRDCRRDRDCTAGEPNLRCYSKPGLADFQFKRCQVIL